MSLLMSSLSKCEAIQKNFEKFFELMSTRILAAGDLVYVTSNIPDPCFNSVIRSTITNADPDLILELVARKYNELTAEHSWWVSDLTMPKELGQRLQERGYQQRARFIGLSLDISEQKAIDFYHEDYTVLQVKEADQLSFWIYPFAGHYQFSAAVSKKLYEQYQLLFHKERSLMHLVVFKQCKPVGCASLLITDNVAGLYNVGFTEEGQQSEIIRVLKNARLSLAKKNNCDLVVLQLPETAYQKGDYNEFESNMIYHNYAKPSN